MTEKQSQGLLNLEIRVLVLFPVVGNPLQAKYSGPYRTSPYRTSPFELVFGHAVRGPLLLLKEKFLDEDP